jgi:hypothetical protein
MRKRKAPVKWSEAEEIVLRELYGKCPISVIAKALRRSVTAVKVRACRLGLSKRAYRSYSKWNDEEVSLLRELYSKAMLPKIARVLGRSTTSVRFKVARLGLSDKEGEKADRKSGKRSENAQREKQKQAIVLVNTKNGVEVTVDLSKMVVVFREDGRTAEVSLRGKSHGLAIVRMLKASGFVSCAGGGWNGG